MIFEGKARILTNGVFYNPRMRFCRDLDMLLYSELDTKEYLDALSATGVRGIRAMLEANCNAIFNDIDPKAVEIIKKNLEINGLSAEVHNRDANVLMRERKFEHIDLDPFGTPSYFIDTACYSAKKYLSITATDTSALCGSATRSGLRKYSVFAVKIDAYHEIGLRALIGFIAREATKYEKVIEVLASWAKEHYYRVHLKVKKSTAKSADIYKKIGYLFYCKRCYSKRVAPMNGECYDRCECGEKLTMIGPIWLGELKNSEIIKSMCKKADKQAKKFLERLKDELDLPTAYNIHDIARGLGIKIPKMDLIIEKLRENGFLASRTHYSGFCIKTNANTKDIKEVLLALNA